MNVIERFWSHVRKTDGCWEWTGSRNHKGYGRFGLRGRNRYAHRVAWEMARGPVTEGVLVCHSCDNPSCVRLEHLFVGTNSDNIKDAANKRRLWVQRNPEGAIARFGKRLRPGTRGENCHWHKLTTADVIEIRRRYAAGGCSQSQLGREFGIAQPTVSEIVARRKWAHV